MTTKTTSLNEGLTKFIVMNGSPSGLVQRGKVHGEENVKTVKAKDLTLAQAKTLHRLRGGTEYKMRADGKKGGEVTNQSLSLIHAPSIPALYRLGLVDFTYTKSACKEDFCYVRLTSCGWAILREFDEAAGGK